MSTVPMLLAALAFSFLTKLVLSVFAAIAI
jgi:hypothetical protein